MRRSSHGLEQCRDFVSLRYQRPLILLGMERGAWLVVHDRLLVGALAAALLLLGKILSPWQQAMGLWNSYRRLSHSRDEYDALIAMPVEGPGGCRHFQVDGLLTIAREGSP